MKATALSIFLSFIMLLAPLGMFAHEGHGAVEHGIWHYLTTPFHLAIMAGIVVSGIVFFLYRFKRKRLAPAPHTVKKDRDA